MEIYHELKKRQPIIGLNFSCVKGTRAAPLLSKKSYKPYLRDNLKFVWLTQITDPLALI